MSDGERGNSMPQCRLYKFCGRDVEDKSVDGLCILHSTDSAKDAHAFAKALATHRKLKGDSFISFVFPGRASFDDATFTKGADFSGATFNRGASFGGVTFSGRTLFARGGEWGPWAVHIFQAVWGKCRDICRTSQGRDRRHVHRQ